MEIRYVNCPQCNTTVRMNPRTRRLNQHKTDQYLPGQRRGGMVRERCVYGGGTFDDAWNKITPLKRMLIDKGVMPK